MVTRVWLPRQRTRRRGEEGMEVRCMGGAVGQVGRGIFDSLLKIRLMRNEFDTQ